MLIPQELQLSRFDSKTCIFNKCPYICNVFFIVLDLRLTKRLAVWEDSLFLCPHTTYIQPSSLDIHIKKSATDKIALFLIMDIRLITLRYSVRWFVHGRDLQK